MAKLFQELKRRKVFRVAVAYAVVAWVLIQIASEILPALQMPQWTVSFVTVLLLLGFPVALLLAWALELSPEGIKADSGIQAVPSATGTDQKLIYATFILVLLAVGFQMADRFVLTDSQAPDAVLESNVVQAPPSQLSINLTDDIAYRALNGGELALAVSPDGSQVVFTGISNNGIQDEQLVRRELANRQILPIPGTEGARKPFFSPDGDSVGFFTNEGLKRVTLDGRPPVTITDVPDNFSTGLWSDGFIFFTSPVSSRQLLKISVEGGSAQEVPIDRPELSRGIISLALIPSTGDIVFSRGRAEEVEIFLLNPDSGETRQLLDNAKLVSYLPQGYLVFYREETLMAARYNATSGQVGFAVPVLEGFATDASGRTPQVAISALGTLVYAVEPGSSLPTSLFWLNSDGSRSFLGELQQSSAIAKLSPNGRVAAIATDSVPFRTYLWDMNLQVPMGIDIRGATMPSWHPDGEHLIFARSSEIIALAIADGSEEVIFNGPSTVGNPILAADGETLVFTIRNDEGITGIYARLPGNPVPEAVIVGAENFYNPALSPDGQWLAYNTGAEGFYGQSVYVARFPSGTERRRVSVDPGWKPQWRSDGQALFYLSGLSPEATRFLQVVEADSSELAVFGRPQNVVRLHEAGAVERSGTFSNWGAHYQSAIDGSRFLMVYRPFTRNNKEIIVAQNWVPELERLLPDDRY